jgi:hypothetical protein
LAGVEKKNIQLLERFATAGHETLTIGFDSHVRKDRNRIRSQAATHGGNLHESFFRPGRKNEARSLPGERKGQGLPDSLRRPSQQNHLAGQAPCHSSADYAGVFTLRKTASPPALL